jgi:hypothetical protein
VSGIQVIVEAIIIKDVDDRVSLWVELSIKGILKLVLTYIFSTRDEGCFFSI